MRPLAWHFPSKKNLPGDCEKSEQSEVHLRPFGSYSQCFICRQWSWEVTGAFERPRVQLCLPCYVDVLEVRQARGAMTPAEPAVELLGEGPDKPGPSPSPYRQLDMFDA